MSRILTIYLEKTAASFKPKLSPATEEMLIKIAPRRLHIWKKTIEDIYEKWLQQGNN